MDFGFLPPEINTGRMYAGPGNRSLLAAAAAWQQLANQLSQTATRYLITAGLLDGLRGPAAVQMGDLMAPYVGWLQATAEFAQQTAARARAAADAYKRALAATVPPQAIVANWSLRTSLVSTNSLGQNTPAIAAAEGQYDQMWAQDAAAMYAYANASAAAATLPPFASPPTAGVGPPRATIADGEELISTGSELVSRLPAALNGLSCASPWRFHTAVLSMAPSLANLSSLRKGFAKEASVFIAVVIGAAVKAHRSNRTAVSVAWGHGTSIGRLSVPRTWPPAARANPFAAKLHGTAAAIRRWASGQPPPGAP